MFRILLRLLIAVFLITFWVSTFYFEMQKRHRKRPMAILEETVQSLYEVPEEIVHLNTQMIEVPPKQEIQVQEAVIAPPKKGYTQTFFGELFQQVILYMVLAFTDILLGFMNDD